MNTDDIQLFRLPKLYENMEEATIGAWLVADGEPVTVGKALVELITDKTILEFESTFSGTLLKTYAPVRSVVPIGYILAAIGPDAATAPDVAPENELLLAAAAAAAAATVPVGRPVSEARSAKKPKPGKLRVAPAARVLAKKHAIDLDEVAKIATGNVIHRKDVEAYLTARSDD
ncbi:MAG: biotin/lipoyl-containing protein [Lentisphaeria bacterium]|jgi:pyruvate/2-oxoglutarate dehydrogenase complex dihydrolipoamide acyltransferase (E2) component|nr:biotin/lipoyl-containing protein [Lentisphaeria bacterium]MDP7743424.1 biotin/lipoyl-containing protein [Lentisphaeria bacterium]